MVKERIEVPLHLYLVEQSEPIIHHNVDTQTDQFAAVHHLHPPYTKTILLCYTTRPYHTLYHIILLDHHVSITSYQHIIYYYHIINVMFI